MSELDILVHFLDKKSVALKLGKKVIQEFVKWHREGTVWEPFVFSDRPEELVVLTKKNIAYIEILKTA